MQALINMLIDILVVAVFLFCTFGWVVVLIGKVIYRIMGKCPNTCFNTKCKWRSFCDRFLPIAYNIEHAKKMMEKKKAMEAEQAEKTEKTKADN